MMKRYCTRCGKKMEEDAEFCVYCGHEMVKEMGETPVFGDKGGELIKEAKREITIVTGLLLALLGIRFIGCLIMTFAEPFYVLDVVVLLAALIGVSLKAKWGSLLALGYHVFCSVVFAIVFANQGAAFVAGGVAILLFISGLSWKEYSSVKARSMILKKESALQTA
jgi:hypothetical protein